jgi:hypothetical protein
MSTALAMNQGSDKMLHVLSTGDLSKLSHDERLSYYKARCDHAGLDPLSVPFEWLTLQGKLILYAKKTAADQLSTNHKLKVTIVSEREFKGVYVVQARAEAPDGRVKDEIGAVPITGLEGANLCNALMKASTKAARRAVLAITGLSMLDETEVETIPAAQVAKPTEAAKFVAKVEALEAKVIEPTPPADMDEEPEQEWNEESAMKARIAAATTLAELIRLVPDIKKMPKTIGAVIRDGAYADRARELQESK